MEAVIFFVFAGTVLVGALGVILGRNPVHSALFLLMTLVSVAVLFLQLTAALVAAIQIVVYASAVVVLFLFVITLLGVDKYEDLEEKRSFQRSAAIACGGLILVAVLAMANGNWVTGVPPLRVDPVTQDNIGQLSDARVGNVTQLARVLFTDYVWAFEITAVLLVIAVVGGVVLARRSSRRIAAAAEEIR